MGRLLLDLLPITILSALTPWAIVAVIVLLASRGLAAAIAFLLGWLTAIIGLGALVLLGVTEGGATHSSSVTWLQIGLQIGFGVFLVLFGQRKWRQRPAPGQEVEEPSWIHRLDHISVLFSYVFGMFWINGFFVVPAALQISQADVGNSDKAIALVFYALGSSAALIGIIAYRILSPAAATRRLANLRHWIGRNSTATIAGVAALIGGLLMLKAVIELIQQL